MRWTIGEEAAEFWDDIWMNEQPLHTLCNSVENLPRKFIKDFWVNNIWDEPQLRSTLILLGVPNNMVRKIMEIPIDGAGKDILRWTSTPHGNFTTSSAWELIRHQQGRMEVFNQIWNPAISPSMSIFVWRLLLNRVPVDTKLQWRNIQLVSKCRCCRNPKIETREHLFIQGDAVTKIWRHFAKWFPDAPPFPTGTTDMEQRIRWWQSHMTRGKKNHVSIIIPCLILWFVWTERNNVIHRGAMFNPRMVMERVQNHLYWATSARKMEAKQWKGSSPKVHFSIPQPRVSRNLGSSIIRWLPPQPNWVKLNTDGAFSGPNSPAGGGGIIRDEHGRILGGFADHFNASSSLEAELKALLQGLNMARRLSTYIWIEVDAKEVVSMIEKRNRGAAIHRYILTEIRNKLLGCQAKISYIPREGNKIADHLAKHGSRQVLRIMFDQETAPPYIKALALMDRLGLPNFRINDEENANEA